MKIAVLGAGAWGTALANILAGKGHEVVLWDFFPEVLEQIRTHGENKRYLPGVRLVSGIQTESDQPRAIAGAEVVICALISAAFRRGTECLREYTGCAISVTKGIEFETGLTMTGILSETAPRARVCALSGPSFAIEVARGMPTAVVAASRDQATAKLVQELFTTPSLRVYTQSDVVGVELGGALKNVIAIAAGISDGLGFGDNSKAALVTRALAELRRLGCAMGAKPETFSGLSGLGDLMLTCFSRLSRNRAFGERIGRGETPQQALVAFNSTVEGYPTARAAWHMASRFGVETPIIREVYEILYHGKDARAALRELMSRDPKPED